MKLFNNMQGLRILMLGRPRLELDGQPVAQLLAAKQQALIFFLAMQPEAVGRNELATLLWTELPEDAARTNLRGVLSRLRRSLPGVLAGDAGEVRFADPAAVASDVAEIAAALALPIEDDESHWKRAVEAAAAWRGPLLEGFEVGEAEGFERWLVLARERVRREVVALRRRLAVAAEAAGGSEAAVAQLRALLDVDETDEDAHQQLMRLLAESGQRTAAIAQYEVCRAVLADRLGARPSAATHALYARIHADAPAVAAKAVGTIAGDSAVPPPRVAADLPPPAPWMPVPLPLPPPMQQGPMIGRVAEMQRIRERLTDRQCRWLTLLGPGGVGKTRLARAAADGGGELFRHGVTWADGRDPRGPLADREAFLQSLQRRIGPDIDRPAALLVVLDNLETVPEAETLARALLDRLPGVTVLATSRRRVGVAREWLLELQGLSLARETPDRPASSAAARLLDRSVRRLDPEFDVQRDSAAVEALCERLAGLPLALHLVARSVRMFGARDVLRRLDDDLTSLLADPEAGEAPHQQPGLAFVMDEAWGQLPELARAALARLAVLPGPFDADLSKRLGIDDAALVTLRDHAWLSRRPDDLLALHPLQQDWLRRRPETQSQSTAVIETLVSLSRAELPAVTIGSPWPADVDASALAARPMQAAAMLDLLGKQLGADADPTRLIDWIEPVVLLLQSVGRVLEADALLDRALRHPALPPWRRAAWMLLRGELHNRRGEPHEATRLLERGLAVLGLNAGPARADGGQPLLAAQWRAWRRVGWPQRPELRAALMAMLQRGIAFLSQQQAFAANDRAAARSNSVALVLARRSTLAAHANGARTMLAYGLTVFGQPRLASWALAGVEPDRRHSGDATLDAFTAEGWCATRMALGRWPGVLERLRRSAEVFARHGDHRHEMECYSLVGKLHFYAGDLALARRQFERCLQLGLERPGGAWRTWGPFGLAEVQLLDERPDLATITALVESGSRWITELEEMDNAYTLRRLGLAARLAWAAGQMDQVRDAVMAGVSAASRFRQCGFWAHEGYHGIAEGLFRLAAHERRIGGAVSPLRQASAVLAAAVAGHARRFVPAAALHRRILAEQALIDGRNSAAGRHLHEAGRLAEQYGMRVDLVRILERQAQLALDGGRDERARRLWDALRQTG